MYALLAWGCWLLVSRETIPYPQGVWIRTAGASPNRSGTLVMDGLGGAGVLLFCLVGAGAGCFTETMSPCG